MTSIKSIILKLFLLIVVFIAVIAAYFILTYEKAKVVVENFEKATLPVISVNYKSLELNMLHGYTNDMEASYMRELITPLEDDKTLPLNIYRFNNTIASISYEVRSLDTKRLIENTKIDNWEVKDDVLNLKLQLSTMIEKNTEYLLIIKLTTEQHGNINYYSRIIEGSECDILAQTEFVNNFSNDSKNPEKFKDYIGYLEISASRDNSNLADVDLTSSFKNITYADMKVESISKPIIAITDLNGDTGSYRLTYKIRSKNSYDTYQYYDVTEFFRLKNTASKTYLYVYDRTLEQIFEPSTQNISANRINLGLDEDLSLHYKYSESGNYISFVKDGSLWSMDMKNNKVVSVFSFDNMDYKDVRTEYNNFDIEVISTDDSGNSLFIVYGYMETGFHEGEVGISLYRYNNKKNVLDEIVFIPSTKPYSILKESVGKFAYLTKDSILYFMIGDAIYTVTMDSNEYVQLVTGLNSSNYSINKFNSIIAWNENTKDFKNTKIRVIDVAKKKDFIIKAEKGEYIRVLGFIENDLIYGVTKESDISNELYPMYKLQIFVHEDGKTETYQKDGIFISDSSFENNVMTLKRVSKNIDGTYTALEDDKLVNKSVQKKELVSTSTIVTELKKTELILNFAYTITSKDALSVLSPKDINFKTPNKLDLSTKNDTISKFYVYENGLMEKSFVNLKEAIIYAQDVFGTVVYENGEKIWARVNKGTLKKLSDTATLVSKHYTSLDQFKSDSGYDSFDLSGLDINYILYYLSVDKPVITNINEYGYVIVSAYSTYLGTVDVIAFTSLSTGEIIKLDYQDAISKITASGSEFLVLFNNK